jgi:DNA invertase Pin-like site-specific DNA recombinase
MKYIAYYRVSTRSQFDSTLGLKAQRKSVMKFINPEDVFLEFTEVETGTNKKKRPILQEALEACKKNDATLIIAKLDRLSRNVAFVSSLLDSKIKFKAEDMPDANELTIHINSANAQHEAKMISTRITDALAIKKEELALKGLKLGNPQNLTEQARINSRKAIKENKENNIHRKRALLFLKTVDFKSTSLRKLASVLNENGYLTSRGFQFTAQQVLVLRNEIEKEKESKSISE